MGLRHRRLTGLLAVATVAGGAGAVAAADLELGAYLAAECRTCHRLEAHEGGIPPIGGLPEAYFVNQMKAFREGRRINETMRSVSASLTDEEIEALAAYFATLGVRSAEQDGGQS